MNGSNISEATGNLQTAVTSLTDVILTRFMFALIILFIGLLTGYLVGRFSKKLFKELELNKLLANITGGEWQIEQALASFLSWFIYIVTLLLTLSRLGIEAFVLNSITIFLILLFLTLVLLGVKDFIPNFFAGLRITRQGYYKKGLKLKVGNVQGTILQIDLLELTVETTKGDIILIPTSYLLHEKVIVCRK